VRSALTFFLVCLQMLISQTSWKNFPARIHSFSLTYFGGHRYQSRFQSRFQSRCQSRCQSRSHWAL
jgi:hypothetical protein